MVGIDAVALVRPKKRAVLRKHARLLRPLKDGSVLVLTLMRYRDFEADPASARAYLESMLGCALAEVQDDARGVLMFSDVAEPRATTYGGVVAEIEAECAGFWVPLDDSPAAAVHAARAAAAKDARIAKRLGGVKDPFSPFGAREVPTDAPLFTGDVAQLEQLAGSFIRIAPDAEVWCLLVRRSTPLRSRALARMTRGVVVLADETVAIHAKYLEGLDAVATRLSNEYAPWIAEHDDPRGVPVFRMGVLHRVQGASSYEDALVRLGEDVRWIVVRLEKEPATAKKKNAAPKKAATAKKKAEPRRRARKD